MFSLISKSRTPAPKPPRRRECALCPNGDGMHPPARLGWQVLDKEAKPLASKKKTASSSLLLLPDAEALEPLGWQPLPVHLAAGPRDWREPVPLETSPFQAPEMDPDPPSAAAGLPDTVMGAGEAILDWNASNYINTPRVEEGPAFLQRCALPFRELADAGPQLESWEHPAPARFASADFTIPVKVRAVPSTSVLRAVLPVTRRLARFRPLPQDAVQAVAVAPVRAVAPVIRAGSAASYAPRLLGPAPSPMSRMAPQPPGAAAEIRQQPAGPFEDRTLRAGPIPPPEPMEPTARTPGWSGPSILPRRYRGWRGNPIPLTFGSAPARLPGIAPVRTPESLPRRFPRLPVAWRVPVVFRAPHAALLPATEWKSAAQPLEQTQAGSWRGFAAQVEIPEIPD